MADDVDADEYEEYGIGPHGYMQKMAPRCVEPEGLSGDCKPGPMGPGQPANEVYPCFCQTPYAMACGETAQVREYPEVAEATPLRISGRVHSGV